MARLPYEGIRILDFGQGAVAPVPVRWMGDYGAEVIHVESHLFYDVDRAGGPQYESKKDLEHSWWFFQYSASKRSITLNLKHPKGVGLVKRLISEWKPNIFIESFTPGTIGRLGLDYETVRELKPDIIYLSTCNQGQTGPHKDRMGYGLIATAVSGLHPLTGWPDRPPALVYGTYSDYVAATVADAVLNAALIHQKRKGKGAYIDLSQQESVTGTLAPPIMDYFLTGRIMQRNGNRIPNAAPHGAFPCKGEDRWVAIAVFTDEEWECFCLVLGNPEWTQDSKFVTLAGRKANEDELERLIGEWTINFTAEQVETMMQDAGVAANVVESGKDFMEDPQVKYVNGMRELDHPLVGKIHVQDAAIKLSKCPDGMFRAPLMGEHNEYVLREILGLTDDEIADLMVDKVITTTADLRL